MEAGAQLDFARRMLDADLVTVWTDYFGLGGTETPRAIEAYLGGEGTLDALQHDVLAHAINERCQDAGLDNPAPYAEDVGAEPR